MADYLLTAGCELSRKPLVQEFRQRTFAKVPAESKAAEVADESPAAEALAETTAEKAQDYAFSPPYLRSR